LAQSAIRDLNKVDHEKRDNPREFRNPSPSKVISRKKPKKSSFFSFSRMPKTKAFRHFHFATLCSQKLHITSNRKKNGHFNKPQAFELA